MWKRSLLIPLIHIELAVSRPVYILNLILYIAMFKEGCLISKIFHQLFYELQIPSIFLLINEIVECLKHLLKTLKEVKILFKLNILIKN